MQFVANLFHLCHECFPDLFGFIVDELVDGGDDVGMYL
jgi:hypothetical protein